MNSAGLPFLPALLLAVGRPQPLAGPSAKQQQFWMLSACAAAG